MSMSANRKKRATRQRVYECAHYEFGYDDFGKNYGQYMKFRRDWCHNPDNPNRECDVHWKLCMKFCPYFKRKPGSYRVLEVTERDRQFMEEAKKKLEAWKSKKAATKAAAEKAEYETYLRLKKKYEGLQK